MKPILLGATGAVDALHSLPAGRFFDLETSIKPGLQTHLYSSDIGTQDASELQSFSSQGSHAKNFLIKDRFS